MRFFSENYKKTELLAEEMYLSLEGRLADIRGSRNSNRPQRNISLPRDVKILTEQNERRLTPKYLISCSDNDPEFGRALGRHDAEPWLHNSQAYIFLGGELFLIFKASGLKLCLSPYDTFIDGKQLFSQNGIYSPEGKTSLVPAIISILQAENQLEPSNFKNGMKKTPIGIDLKGGNLSLVRIDYAQKARINHRNFDYDDWRQQTLKSGFERKLREQIPFYSWNGICLTKQRVVEN